MRKQFLFAIISAFCCCGIAIAQDVIITTDSKKIEAKITEVSKSEVRYKDFDNQNGPTFVLGTDDIVAIIYSNNKVALYCTQAEPSQNLSEQTAEASAKAEAERDAKSYAGIAKASQFGSLFGNSGDSGQKGKTVGCGSLGAATWSLAGRECKSVAQPSNNFNQEGKVVVSIQVNDAGNVVSASIENGTTISDYATQQIALKAARETKFSSSKDKVQIGTITYIFKFK